MRDCPPTSSQPYGLFRCPKCTVRCSYRAESIFSNSHLPMHLLLQLMLRWFLREKYTVTLRETGISERTLNRVNLVMNAFASILMERESTQIGGPYRVVEIDESLLHRRKYNVGRGKEEGWILGGIERPQGAMDKPRVFLAVCPDRSKESLQTLIQKWVKKGTIVLTDGFASYNGLSKFGYHHYVVNHKKHFVAPNSRAHTQRIEGLWGQIRKDGLPRVGCRFHDVSFHLSAYLYRRSRANSIERFLSDLPTVSRSEIQSVIRKRAAQIREERKEDDKLSLKKQSIRSIRWTKEDRIEARMDDYDPGSTQRILEILRETEMSTTRRKTVEQRRNKLAGLREKIPSQEVSHSVEEEQSTESTEKEQTSIKTDHKKTLNCRCSKRELSYIIGNKRYRTPRKCAGRRPGFYH